MSSPDCHPPIVTPGLNGLNGVIVISPLSPRATSVSAEVECEQVFQGGRRRAQQDDASRTYMAEYTKQPSALVARSAAW